MGENVETTDAETQLLFQITKDLPCAHRQASKHHVFRKAPKASGGIRSLTPFRSAISFYLDGADQFVVLGSMGCQILDKPGQGLWKEFALLADGMNCT